MLGDSDLPSMTKMWKNFKEMPSQIILIKTEKESHFFEKGIDKIE